MTERVFRLSGFYRFFYAGTLAVFAAVFALGPGWVEASVAASALALIVFAVIHRVTLRVTEAGIEYRGWLPGSGWAVAWERVLGVSVDRVRVASTSDGGGKVQRISVEHRDGPPYRVEAFGRAACDELADLVTARGLSVLRLDSE